MMETIQPTTEPPVIGNKASLVLTMTNGNIKLYDVTATELLDFIVWYDASSKGTANAYYIMKIKNPVAPYISKKVYIAYDKISSFEVNEYNQ